MGDLDAEVRLGIAIGRLPCSGEEQGRLLVLVKRLRAADYAEGRRAGAEEAMQRLDKEISDLAIEASSFQSRQGP